MVLLCLENLTEVVVKVPSKIHSLSNQSQPNNDQHYSLNSKCYGPSAAKSWTSFISISKITPVCPMLDGCNHTLIHMLKQWGGVWSKKQTP
jgi:hypothetical protein